MTNKYESYLTIIINVVILLRENDLCNRLTNKGVCEMLRKLNDIGQNGRGKYLGHPLWTDAAHAKLIEALDHLNPRQDCAYAARALSRDISHEHPVPLNYLVDILFKQQNGSPEAIRETIKSLGIVVIMTREEEKTLQRGMPADWNGNDKFARYRARPFFMTIKDLNLDHLEVDCTERRVL